MIVTLTPNPSIDRTVELAGPLERGAVQRSTGETSHPGGKGVNISRAAAVAGVATLAVLPARADDTLVLALASLGIGCRPVEPAGDVRVNLTLVESDGTTTKVNSPGAPVGAATLEGMERTLLEVGDEADWIVLAGSLPPGAPATWYADLVGRLRRAGRRVAVDTSEGPLAALAGSLPDAAPSLLKPNGEELASLTGGDPDLLESDPLEAARAAAGLVDRGVGAVLATLGGHGAVLVTDEGSWVAVPPRVAVRSTVGAGDSSLLGYLLGDLRGLAPAERLRLAVAYGTAAASLPGTTVPTPEQARPDLVELHELDLATRPATRSTPGGRP